MLRVWWEGAPFSVIVQDLWGIAMDGSELDDVFEPVFHRDLLSDHVADEIIDDPFENLETEWQGQFPHTAFVDDQEAGLIDLIPVIPSRAEEANPLTGMDYTDSLTSATADVGTVPSLMQQPWETGPMGQLFSNSASFSTLPKGVFAEIGVCRPHHDEEVSVKTAVVKAKSSKQPLVPSFLHMVCNVKDVDFLENRRASMKVAIDKFCKLVLMNPLGFELGAHLEGPLSGQSLEKEIIDWSTPWTKGQMRSCYTQRLSMTTELGSLFQ